jgi:ZIP family zinc transporter
LTGRYLKRARCAGPGKRTSRSSLDGKDPGPILLFDWFKDLSPILQAFLATSFNWFLTACGAALVFLFKTINRKVLGRMLGFAAGVMIFVVVEELISESQMEKNTDIATVGTMLGFSLMMALDVALG